MTEEPVLTPWPCHKPTDKELADLDEREKKDINEMTSTSSETDGDYKMVYSRVHG